MALHGLLFAFPGCRDFDDYSRTAPNSSVSAARRIRREFFISHFEMDQSVSKPYKASITLKRSDHYEGEKRSHYESLFSELYGYNVGLEISYRAEIEVNPLFCLPKIGDKFDANKHATYFFGMMTEFSIVSVSGEISVEIKLESFFTVLDSVKRYRAFENKTAREMIEYLLDQYRFKELTESKEKELNVKWLSKKEHVVRFQTLQMGLTDKQFFDLLMHQEFLMYFFVHDAHGTHLIITDDLLHQYSDISKSFSSEPNFPVPMNFPSSAQISDVLATDVSKSAQTFRVTTKSTDTEFREQFGHSSFVEVLQWSQSFGRQGSFPVPLTFGTYTFKEFGAVSLRDGVSADKGTNSSSGASSRSSTDDKKFDSKSFLNLVKQAPNHLLSSQLPFEVSNYNLETGKGPEFLDTYAREKNNTVYSGLVKTVFETQVWGLASICRIFSAGSGDKKRKYAPLSIVYKYEGAQKSDDVPIIQAQITTVEMSASDFVLPPQAPDEFEKFNHVYSVEIAEFTSEDEKQDDLDVPNALRIKFSFQQGEKLKEEKTAKSVRCRYSTFWAGNTNGPKEGAFYFPKPKTEGFVIFPRETPDFPVFVGGLYNSTNAVPIEDLNAKDPDTLFKRGQRTEHTAVFIDTKYKKQEGKLSVDNERMSIEAAQNIFMEADNITSHAQSLNKQTVGKKEKDSKENSDATPLCMVMMENDKEVLIKSPGSSDTYVKLSKAGNKVQINAQGDISVATKANINQEAQSNVKVKATSGLDLNGAQVKINGQSTVDIGAPKATMNSLTVPK